MPSQSVSLGHSATSGIANRAESAGTKAPSAASFNFENDNYTDLSNAALAGWKRLEADSGEMLIPSLIL